VEDLPVLLQGDSPFHFPMHPLPPAERRAGRYPRPYHRESRHVDPHHGDAHQPGIHHQARRHSRYAFALRDGVPGEKKGSYQPLFSLPHEFQAPEAGAPYYEAARAALHRNPGTNYIAEDAALKIGAEPSSFFTYKTKDLNEFFVTHPAISNGQMSFDAHAAGHMVTASGAIQPFSFTINKNTGVVMSPYGIRDMSPEELERERLAYLDRVAGELFAGMVELPPGFHPPYDPQVASAYPTSTPTPPLHPRPNVTMHRVDLRNQWGGAFMMECPIPPTEELCESGLTDITSELSRLIA
jgi:hypothetical protein